MGGTRVANDLDELTVFIRFPMGHQLADSCFDEPNELFADLQVGRGPDLLIQLDREQSLGLRIFEPLLLEPEPSLKPHSATQKVCVVDRMRFSVVNPE